MGDEQSHRGLAVGRQGAAAVEPVPADPEHRCPDHRHARVVRRAEVAGESLTLSDHQGGDQGRDPRRGVDDQAACEVHRMPLGQPSAAPDPVRHRGIDQQQPEAAEGQHRRETNPLDVGAHDQCGRDDREGRLEHEERAFRDRAFQGLGAHRTQERPAEAADQGPGAVERQTVADGQPEHRNEAGNGDAMHHHREAVLGSDKAGVEQGQAGHGHEQDQRRRGQDPCRVTRRGPGRLGQGEPRRQQKRQGKGAAPPSQHGHGPLRRDRQWMACRASAYPDCSQ